MDCRSIDLKGIIAEVDYREDDWAFLILPQDARAMIEYVGLDRLDHELPENEHQLSETLNEYAKNTGAKILFGEVSEWIFSPSADCTGRPSGFDRLAVRVGEYGEGITFDFTPSAYAVMTANRLYLDDILDLVQLRYDSCHDGEPYKEGQTEAVKVKAACTTSFGGLPYTVNFEGVRIKGPVTDEFVTSNYTVLSITSDKLSHIVGTKEAAEILNLSSQRINQLADDDFFQSKVIGNTRIFDRDELKAFAMVERARGRKGR